MAYDPIFTNTTYVAQVAARIAALGGSSSINDLISVGRMIQACGGSPTVDPTNWETQVQNRLDSVGAGTSLDDMYLLGVLLRSIVNQNNTEIAPKALAWAPKVLNAVDDQGVVSDVTNITTSSTTYIDALTERAGSGFILFLGTTRATDILITVDGNPAYEFTGFSDTSSGLNLFSQVTRTEGTPLYLEYLKSIRVQYRKTNAGYTNDGEIQRLKRLKITGT